MPLKIERIAAILVVQGDDLVLNSTCTDIRLVVGVKTHFVPKVGRKVEITTISYTSPAKTEKFKYKIRDLVNIVDVRGEIE